MTSFDRSDNMYELIFTSPTSGYVVDRSTKRIVCCVETMRPDLEFKELQNMINKANKWDETKMEKDDEFYSEITY